MNLPEPERQGRDAAVRAAANGCRHGHAVVMGAGMAGLLAAHVLAPHYRSVTVVERDRLPLTPQFRKGVPQSRHTHLLLGRGLESLETLLPGIVGELLDRGAVPLDWPGDALWLTPAGWSSRFRPGMSIVSASRDLVEWSVRQRVLSHPGIQVLEATEVTALIPSGDGRGVAGVHVRDRNGQLEQDIPADLVLDTSGRGSKASAWLSALGWQPAQEPSVPTKVSYVSRWYQRPDEADAPDWSLILLQTQPPEHTRSGMLLPVDGGRWMVSLVGVGGDDPPTSEEGFLEFARSLRDPVLYEAIREAKPLSPIHSFRVPDSRRRRYERERRWPEGFAVIGDALCSLNPMYAQGMSVAAVTALAVGEEVSRRSSKPLGRRIQRRAARSGADSWLIASGEDLRYLPPHQRGRRPLHASIMQAYFDRVLRAARTDATVNAALLKVLNLQSGPYSMLRPAVLHRSLLKRQAPAETALPQAGPAPSPGSIRASAERNGVR